MHKVVVCVSILIFEVPKGLAQVLLQWESPGGLRLPSKGIHSNSRKGRVRGKFGCNPELGTSLNIPVRRHGRSNGTVVGRRFYGFSDIIMISRFPLKKTITNWKYSTFASSSNNNITSYFSNLIQHSLSSKSLVFTQLVHAQLIKLRLSNQTFLGNRLLDSYSKFSPTIRDSVQVFEEIDIKNTITWNILLAGFFKLDHVERALSLFVEMPQRDVVTWNSMISGYGSNGYVSVALQLFFEMQSVGVKPSAFTFSLVMSYLTSLLQAKQLHATIIRSGSSNLVLCNCLIDIYGKIHLIDYAFGVFLCMEEELDVISWNSLISACLKSDYCELAFHQFCLMTSAGYLPDHFTLSTVITCCSNLCDLGKGKQVFVFCIKTGCLCNSIVSSAAIDMFSKCDRLKDSILIFENINRWNSALCDSMISCYVLHGFVEEAQSLFVRSFRTDVRPTEFSLSAVLKSTSFSFPENQGIQIHTLVIKLGFESYKVIASSLVDTYNKSGLIHCAMQVFTEMGTRDLISWNTMIMGFARNGRGWEALQVFEQLVAEGVVPDRITLFGVLLACCHGGLLIEGKSIFSSMEKNYGIIPRVEHYACLVNMMCQVDKVMEAIETIETMPYEPNAWIWELLLGALKIDEDLELTERIAERVMELEPQSSLPYIVLAKVYEMKGRWESVVRVRRAMKERGVHQVNECTWIGIKNQVFAFKENQILRYGGEDTCSALRLLVWEMGKEGCEHQQHDGKFGDGNE